jgi:hypothetical protein
MLADVPETCIWEGRCWLCIVAENFQRLTAVEAFQVPLQLDRRRWIEYQARFH